MNRKQNIILSILVPAYNYPTGIKRLLDKLHSDKKKNYEIIISDDSSNDEVRNLVLNNGYVKDDRVIYVAHNSSGNAVDNWNFLIEKSKGKYIQFMHHDEFPDSRSYLDNILEMLEDEKIDLIITKCILLKNNYFYKLTNTFLKKIVLMFPYFLIFKNVYGSPSNFLFLNQKNLTFDRDLIYLVDIDFYIRLIMKSSNTVFLNNPVIISEIDSGISITSKIKSTLPDIIRNETKILKERYKNIKISWITLFLLTIFLYFTKIKILISRFIFSSKVS
jgi:glycosyltransferase involved in cell wall biosynthesis